MIIMSIKINYEVNNVNYKAQINFTSKLISQNCIQFASFEYCINENALRVNAYASLSFIHNVHPIIKTNTKS